MNSRTISRSPIAIWWRVALLLSVVSPIVDASWAATPRSRPNVVFILTDDQTLEQMGCYGGDVATPHMDRLAAEGVRFTRFHASSAICTPARYTALTGQYVSRCRELRSTHPTSEPPLLMWNASFLPDDFTVARALNGAGYATGIVGKWHNGLPSMQDVAADADPLDPAVAALCADNYQRIRDYIRTGTGFQYVESIYGTNYRWLPIPESLQFHNQEWITQGAVRFIEQNRHRPFFLYTATTLPHAPGARPSLHADSRATPAGWLSERPDVQPPRPDVLDRAEQAGRSSDGYWAGLVWLDDGVGAVLQTLDDLDLAGNTLVILASDHQRVGKMTCNLGKAACLIRWPGRVPAGEVSNELVSNVDIVPTILDACRVPTPEHVPIDGVSWLPLLSGRESTSRDSLYLEVTYTRGVVTKDWKYIATRFPQEIDEQMTPENRRRYNQEGTLVSHGSTEHVRYQAADRFPGYYDDDQLYDLRVDPEEQHNLATDLLHADTLSAMKERLRAYCQQLPHRFGEFKEDGEDGAIRPYEPNPAYWQYRGKPVLLIGGSDRDNIFHWADQRTRLTDHLDLLASCGGNYIRCTMSSREYMPEGHRWDFLPYPFAQCGDGRYDLERWNDEYWNRLRIFLTETQNRGIIVQLELWDRWNESGDSRKAQLGWYWSPWNPNNNVNYAWGDSPLLTAGRTGFYNSLHAAVTDEDPVLLPYQERFVEKILSEVIDGGFDHVLFQVDNESGFGDERMLADIGWARRVREYGESRGVELFVCSQRRFHPPSPYTTNQFRDWQNPDVRVPLVDPTFSFCDISQNNGSVGQEHYDNILWFRAKVRDHGVRPINHTKSYHFNWAIGADWKEHHPGTDAEATARLWRAVFAGAAAFRFHRMTEFATEEVRKKNGLPGIGLSPLAQTHLKSIRSLVNAIDVFQMQPANRRLADRTENEAYCLADSKTRCAVFFTGEGDRSVTLDRGAFSGDVLLRWLNIAHSEWTAPERLDGRRPLVLTAPTRGQWVVVLNLDDTVNR